MDVEQMDKTMMENWNKTVRKDDVVFHLGDFSFYDFDKTKEILEKLHGYKILIKGNHDTKGNNFYIEAGFAEVSNYSIVYQENYILTHKPPTFFNETMPFFWIHGHSHNTPLYPAISKHTANVSVEKWDYKPVELNHLIDLTKVF